MPYDYGKLKRVSVDPAVVEGIRRSPRMLAEQGPGFMESWGGPSMYQTLAKLPMRQRLTYAACLDNYGTADEIASVTGLSVAEVDKALAELQEQGLVAKA